jgi:hypothetical protein
MWLTFSISPGSNLLKKMKEASKMRAKHIQNHALFTSTFQEETIMEWTLEIEAWNRDNRKPNPYEDKPLSKYYLVSGLSVYLSLS